MVIARQSTARIVMVGPILDAAGVVVTTAVVGDLKISKNGGVPAALNASATLTHRHTGHYSLSLTTSDLDTVGQAEVGIDSTTNAMPIKVITVIEEAIYDAFYAASATGLLPTNVTQFGGTNGTFAAGRPEVNTSHIAGAAVSTSTAQIGVNVVNAAGTAWGSGAITAASIAADAITAAKIANGAIDAATFAAGAIDAAAIATNAIDADALAADAVTEIWAGSTAPSAATIADAVWDEDATAHQTQGTFGQAIGDPVADTNTIYKAVVTDATGGTVGVDVVAVKGDTAAILADTGTDGVVVAASSKSGYSLTATTGLGNQTANITGNVSGSVGSVTAAVTVGSINANAVDAAALAADAIAEIADGVWDEDATGHQTQGTFGQAIGDPVADTNTIYKAVVTDATGATIGVDVVAVKAETASIQTDTNDIQARLPAALVSGRMDSSVGAMAADVVTSAALAASAVTEIQTGLSTLDAAGVRSAVGLASANLDTQLSTIDTVVDSILVDTAEIGVAGAGLTAINLPDQTMNITGDITGNLTGSVGSVSARVTANTDQLNGNAAAAATLAILNGANVVYIGTVTGAATTTTLIDSGLTQGDADHWKGRIIIFTSVIALQATDITAFNPATDQLTFTAVTQAPTGATYVII